MRIKDSRDFGTELLKELLFPARCPVCGDPVPVFRRVSLFTADRGTEKKDRGLSKESAEIFYRGLICDPCRETFAYIRAPFCRKCGKQLSAERAENQSGLCRDCASSGRLFRQARCLVSYDETAREIMAAVKYHSRREYLDLFAVMAADRLGDWILSLRPDCLVPVPVHGSRLRSRGYNQAEVFAEGIGSLLGIPVRKDILLRRKNTTAQKELGAEERLMNLQNAFGYGSRLPEGSTVLLADDIYTTGSTLEACTEALLAAGAGTVYGLCICAGEDA